MPEGNSSRRTGSGREEDQRYAALVVGWSIDVGLDEHSGMDGFGIAAGDHGDDAESLIEIDEGERVRPELGERGCGWPVHDRCGVHGAEPADGRQLEWLVEAMRTPGSRVGLPGGASQTARDTTAARRPRRPRMAGSLRSASGASLPSPAEYE